jgi:hypothetical protein
MAQSPIDPQQRVESMRKEISRLELHTIELQHEIAQLEGEIRQFEVRYERVVGTAQIKLDMIKAAIAQLEAKRPDGRFGDWKPLQSPWQQPADYVSVEEQYRRAWNKDGNHPPTPPPTVPQLQTKPTDKEDKDGAIKRMFRALARRFHPDFARDNDDRARRNEIMIRINEAYAARDFEALQALAAQPDVATSAVSLAAMSLRHLERVLSNAQERVDELESLRATLMHGDMMKLKIEEKLASARGRDVLKEIAARIEQECVTLKVELERLRKLV